MRADRELRLDADHRVVRAGHARVGDRRGAAAGDARVVRLHVRVRADHRRHAARRASRASAIFSLVASAWKSTTMTCAAGAPPRRARPRPRTGCGRCRGRADPCRLITATGVPSAASTTASPRPGEPAAEVRRPDDALGALEVGAISARRQVWLPSVSTSAPAASSRSASFGVMPAPSAAFSPLTTQKSAPSSRCSGRQALLDRAAAGRRRTRPRRKGSQRPGLRS